MKRFLSGLCATGLALTFAATSFAPAQAAPLVPMSVESGTSDVIQIRDRHWDNNGGGWNGKKYYKRYNNRGWDNRRHYNGRYYNNNGRYYRYGNNYNGAGVAAGVLAGALITGAIVNSQQPRAVYNGGGSAHVQWCYNRYRSYRAYDNTFQPYNGPRQQCYSPY